MKRKTLGIIMAALLAGQILTGCSGNQTEQTTGHTQEEGSVEADGQNGDSDSKVASADEMAEPEELDTEGLKEITGEMVKDGVYPITVDSSSSMFQIEACELTVKDGEMTAVMTMGGTGYLKVFMGTGEEAAEAEEEDCIAFQENEAGQHTFTVPVEALNKQLDCAAYSKKKEKWYERKLVFRADSLPVDALADGVVTTVDSLNLTDGEYTVEVTLEGGSGRADVESPAQLRVSEGQAYANLVWSSPNYDYMKVDGVRYELSDTEGNSNFEIPVNVFDWAFPVIADTTAMSQPHEIEYTLRFDSSTIEKTE